MILKKSILKSMFASCSAMVYIRIQKMFSEFQKLPYQNVRLIIGTWRNISSSYYFMPGDVPLSGLRIGDLIDRSADRSGDKTAIVSVHQNISKTYSEFRHESERLASGLISTGLKKGDRIALCSPNCYEWPLTQIAAAKAGLILVNINPASQTEELEYCLKKVDCKALVTWDVFKTQDFYKILCDIIPNLPDSSPGKLQSSKLPTLESVVMISNDKRGGILSFKDVLGSGNKESDKLLSEIENTVQFDDPANIQFTSGTTGKPKGVVLTHHNLVNNASITGPRFGFDSLKPTACCQIPLFHSFGCVHASLGILFHQGTCVFPSVGFDPISSLKAIEKYKCSIVYGSPTMFVDMIRNFKSEKFDVGYIKQVLLGGAATPAELIKEIKEIFGATYVLTGYGMTETSTAVSLSRRSDDIEKVANGITDIVEYVEVKIINDKGQVVPVNSQGEICVRGHPTFLGYWDDEKKTAEVLDNARWYHSGDLGRMNEDGSLKIVGRITDMINRGGENIYPLEVELFLNSHPAIQEVYICGVPDQRLGEEACAWICVKKGMHVTEQEIKQFCKGKISHFKIPRYIMFVEEFPKTQTGKVQKFEMSKISIEKLKL